MTYGFTSLQTGDKDLLRIERALARTNRIIDSYFQVRRILNKVFHVRVSESKFPKWHKQTDKAFALRRRLEKAWSVEHERLDASYTSSKRIKA